MRRLDHLLFTKDHIIAQVIKSELIVRSVGNVAAVRLSAGHMVHIVLNDADGQSQKFIERPHPLAVAPCQVIVDGHDMHTLAGERV